MNNRLPVWLRAISIGAGILLLGIVDWLTGIELNFFVFYFLPVSVSAWFYGVGFAVTAAIASALVWFGADVLSGHVYSAQLYSVWNTMIRLISFIAIGWAVSRLRQLLDREHTNAEALRRALSEVRVLETFLSICAQCKKIRNQEGVWEPLEVYIGQRTDTRFSHGYCPECAQAVLEEAGLTGKKTV
ncbi:MAG: hypothetical protein R6V60_19825 [Desulfobacterales bacterium]